MFIIFCYQDGTFSKASGFISRLSVLKSEQSVFCVRSHAYVTSVFNGKKKEKKISFYFTFLFISCQKKLLTIEVHDIFKARISL